MSTEVRPAFGQMRIPDILETIADLSNDEVFTPPDLANKVLDMLPESIWTDSSVTFLDPATKTGVFLREITKRLIAGLEHEFPDLQERVNHILTKQVYGLGITELTSLMSRRTVYCSTAANGLQSVCTDFDNPEGNIKYPNNSHTFNENGKCDNCGAGEDMYNKVGNIDNYAYSFIHDNLEEVLGLDEFDVIIGNPPVSINNLTPSSEEEEKNFKSRPQAIYNEFIERAISMEPKYLLMVIPSRWMKGGSGLSKFRSNMIEDKRIREIVDYELTSHVIPSQTFFGGVQYFFWDKDYNGDVKYTFIDKNKETITSKRSLKSKYSDTIIRDPRQESIIAKCSSEDKFSKIVESNSFGLANDLFNKPEKYIDLDVSNKIKKGYVLCYGVEGMNGAVRRKSKHVRKNSIQRGVESIDKFNLFFSGTFSIESTVPPKIIRGLEGEVSTQTFFKIGDFNLESEMDNCLSYIKTKFFRALFHFNRYSFNISLRNFELIPLQEFSKSWTDEELYKKYKLTEEEIAYIEENIEVMD